MCIVLCISKQSFYLYYRIIFAISVLLFPKEDKDCEVTCNVTFRKFHFICHCDFRAQPALVIEEGLGTSFKFLADETQYAIRISSFYSLSFRMIINSIK
jgi:hypothetical protein